MENDENKTTGTNEDIRNAGFQYGRFGRRYPRNTWLPGLVIIIVGIVILLKRLPQSAHLFPDWLFDWPVILIVVGITGGARHGFRYHFGWLFPVLIGLYFLLKDQDVILDKWDVYIFPVILILAGLFLLIRRKDCRSMPYNRNDMRFYHRMKRRREFWEAHRQQRFGNRYAEFSDQSSEDYINVNSVFGSAEKTMFSKTFKGGNISCTFGGAELHLTQADITETAVLNISIAFGGAEITVPANWTIQNELTAFMGGIEDKRRISSLAEPPKILILRGNVFCGGVEIKN